MNEHEDSDLRAGEYVLGTLEGAERRRFEAELARDPALQDAVSRWEARLAPLALSLPPVAPDPGVWLALIERLRRQQVQRLPAAPATGPRWLTAWAALSTAASVALAALLLWQQPPPAPAPEVRVQTVEKPVIRSVYVAYLKMPDADMHWTVSAVPEEGLIRVQAGGTPPDGAQGRSPELWWLGDEGPVSLGVIPVQGERQVRIPARIADFQGRSLAVSLEPAGGSPTGQPTGPVVAVAPALRAI